jgi:hypothetical protein
MPKFRARRGAVVVLLGIMIIALMALVAIAMDFSRLWALKNELQTAADAGAHAGAIQLLPPNNAAGTIASAQQFAGLNLAMQGTVTVDSVELGDWDDVAKTFTPATPGAPHTDAVNVVVSRQSTGLVMAMLGVPAPRLKARAIGWADAPVASAAGCMKPIAIPYVQLMYRINQKRGIPNTPDTLGLYRPFDQVQDLAILNNMTPTERTFSLKVGSGTVSDTLGQLPGNYQMVKLPELWDVSTGLPGVPGPDNRGAQAYVEHMSGLTCYTLEAGDSLETQTGVIPHFTICGMWPGAQGCGGTFGPGVCSVIRGDPNDPLNTPQSSTSFGDCEDASGNAGVDVKSAFYMCRTNCTGNNHVEVSLLGSFTLTKVFPDRSRGNAYSTWDLSEIVGIFKPIQDPGTIGAGSTTLVKPILVK